MVAGLKGNTNRFVCLFVCEDAIRWLLSLDDFVKRFVCFACMFARKGLVVARLEGLCQQFCLRVCLFICLQGKG